MDIVKTDTGVFPEPSRTVERLTTRGDGTYRGTYIEGTRHGVTPAQVVIRWHVDHGVVVIPKSATPERIAANLDVLGFSLADNYRVRVDGLSDRSRPVH